MGISYVKLQAKAKALIESNGRNVTFTVKAETSADTSKPWRSRVTGDDSSVGPVKAVVTDYDEKAVDGSLIVRGDKHVIVAYTSLGVDLRYVTTMTDSAFGDVYQIINVNILAPGANVIIYEMQARR